MEGQTSVLISYNTSRFIFTLALCCIPYVFFKLSLLVACVVFGTKLSIWTWTHYVSGRVTCKDRGVFITGCDSGLGHAFAKHLDKLGFTVFAGCFKEDGEGARHLLEICSRRIHIVPIDVTSDASVDKAVHYVTTNLPQKGLWGVVNNAGINLVGEVELSPVSIYEKGYSVNLFGPIRVHKAFLPLVRKSKGRLINITSVRGRIDEPRQAVYGSAKHALETLSDSLRMEMKKFGVHVAIVEPGAYGFMTSIENEEMVTRKTQELDDMWKGVTPEVQKAYGRKYVMSWQNKPMVHGWTARTRDIRPVSYAVEHALCSETPRARYLIGGLGSMISFIDEFVVMARIYSIFPTWMIDSIVAFWTHCDDKEHH